MSRLYMHHPGPDRMEEEEKHLLGEPYKHWSWSRAGTRVAYSKGRFNTSAQNGPQNLVPTAWLFFFWGGDLDHSLQRKLGRHRNCTPFLRFHYVHTLCIFGRWWTWSTTTIHVKVCYMNQFLNVYFLANQQPKVVLEVPLSIANFWDFFSYTI